MRERRANPAKPAGKATFFFFIFYFKQRMQQFLRTLNYLLHDFKRSNQVLVKCDTMSNFS